MAFWHANGSGWGQYMGFRKAKVATTNDERAPDEKLLLSPGAGSQTRNTK